MRGKTRRVKTTDQRVKYITDHVKTGRKSPKVHAFASMGLTDYCGDKWCIAPRDWLGEVAHLADHIKQNVRYTLDTFGIDVYRTPQRTLDMAMGDCDDMASLAGAILEAVGYPVKIKVVQTQGFDDFHHIYILAGIPPQQPQRWIAVDPTQDLSCGWEPNNIVKSKVYPIIA